MDLQHFWQYQPTELYKELETSATGLSANEAAIRIKSVAATKKSIPPFLKDLFLFLSQNAHK